MRKLAPLPVAILLVCLLGGCAGLVALIFDLLAVGTLVAQVSDFFGRDSSDFTLYFDGYNTGESPNPDRTLNLEGLPSGDHILTLATNDRRVGFHRNVNIRPNQSVDLGVITPIQGGVIAGQVTREVNGTQAPLAGARVAAIFGGGALISQANGRLVSLPPTDTNTLVIMGFTDVNGNYRLGPAQFGEWLVTTVYPGLYTDVRVVTVASGNDANDTNLALRNDPAVAAPANVQGTVVREGGNALPAALVALDLGTALQPTVDPNRVAALQAQLGFPLRPQPWTAWASVATQTSQSGAYVLVAPPGTHSLYAFKYDYLAETTTATLTPGSVETVDFTLERR